MKSPWAPGIKGQVVWVKPLRMSLEGGAFTPGHPPVSHYRTPLPGASISWDPVRSVFPGSVVLAIVPEVILPFSEGSLVLYASQPIPANPLSAHHWQLLKELFWWWCEQKLTEVDWEVSGVEKAGRDKTCTNSSLREWSPRGILTWTELHHWLYWFSSLQMADYGTSLPP